MDPYDKLKLPRNATVDQVKRAYYYIAKMYHPNKGGNPQEFAEFQNAYRIIMNDLKGKNNIAEQGTYVAPRDYNQLKQGSQSAHSFKQSYTHKPSDFRAQSGNFDAKKFNQNFNPQLNNNNSENSGYVYNVDDSVYKERTRADFERHNAAVTAEAESITPMFRNRFDNNTFNRMFEKMKSQHKTHTGEVEEYKEPEPMTGTALIPYSDVNKMSNTSNLTSLGHADINVYDKMHKNPSKFDNTELSRMGKMKDITNAEPLDQGTAKKRISDYNGMKLQYNKDPLITDATVPIPGGNYQPEGLVAAKTTLQESHNSQESMHSRMMELRKQPSQLMKEVGQVPMGMPMMQYPENSHQNHLVGSKKEVMNHVREINMPQNEFLPTEDQHMYAPQRHIHQSHPTQMQPQTQPQTHPQYLHQIQTQPQYLHQIQSQPPQSLQPHQPHQPHQHQMQLQYLQNLQSQNMENKSVMNTMYHKKKTRIKKKQNLEKELKTVRETVKMQQRMINSLIRKKKKSRN